jgi:hypothetical protein
LKTFTRVSAGINLNKATDDDRINFPIAGVAGLIIVAVLPRPSFAIAVAIALELLPVSIGMASGLMLDWPLESKGLALRSAASLRIDT